MSTPTDALIDPAASRPRRRPLPWPGGRRGRVRYVACVMGLTVLCASLFSLLAGVLMQLTSPAVGMPILVGARLVLFMLVLPAGILFWSVERAHDIGWSGKVAVLLLALAWLVPQLPVVGSMLKPLHLLNLVFWLWPGQGQENRFGPPPVAARLWVKLALAAMLIGLILTYAFSRAYGPRLPVQPVSKPPVQLPTYGSAK